VQLALQSLLLLVIPIPSAFSPIPQTTSLLNHRPQAIAKLLSFASISAQSTASSLLLLLLEYAAAHHYGLILVLVL